MNTELMNHKTRHK